MIPIKKLSHQLFPQALLHRRLVDAGRHFARAAATASRNPSTAAPRPSASAAAAKTHFLVSWLVKSCGFSKSEAAEVSKHVVARIKSPKNADAVLSFFRQQGLTKTHIRQVVSGEPALLCASVSKTLEPKFRVLEDAGFSGSDIASLFAAKPRALRVANLGAKVQFLSTVFGSKEKLLKAILKNRYIVFSSLDEKMRRNVSLLRECVGSEQMVTKMISRRYNLLSAKTDTLKEVIRRVESFGISRDSGLFVKALYVLFENSIKNLDAKFELLKSFGWSDGDFTSAVQKSPTFLGSSKEKIQSIMDFLLNEVGCEPSYVANHPKILTFSLEHRMMPRHSVLRTLILNGLIGREYEFYSVVNMSDKDFLNRYVLRYSEKAPELYQSYAPACSRGSLT